MRKRRVLASILVIILMSAVLSVLSASVALADTWTQMNVDGFGVPANVSATTAQSAGVYDPTVGTRNTASGCQVWQYNHTAMTWKKINTADGFGDKNNVEITAIIQNSVGDPIYFATRNVVTGCELWHYNPSSSTNKWTKLGPDGLGYAGNTEISSFMTDWGNYRVFLGTTNNSGCQVWLLKTQTKVLTEIVGPSVSAVQGPGFGETNNVSASAMAKGYDANLRLLVGTRNTTTGGQVWKSGSNLVTNKYTKVNANGFGNVNNAEVTTLITCLGTKTYAGTENKSGGAQVWTKTEGDGGPYSPNWVKMTTGWSADKNNSAVSSVSRVSNSTTITDMYFGTYNDSTGGELWKYSNSSWNKIASDGFGSAANISVNFLQSNQSNSVRRVVAITGGDTPGGAKVWNNFGEGPPPAQNPVTWYLAEGTSAWGFSTYVTIENPNTTATTATITYQTTDGAVPGGTVNLPAKSQTTVNPKDVLGEKDFSTKVVSNEGKEIAVDRTMKWKGAGAPSEEGHSSIGVTNPAKIWYLPEGASAWGFECWLLIQNPGNANATCTVTYMIEGEAAQTKTKTVAANSRESYNMFNDIGEKNSSIKVSSNVPVIAERAMYRNSRREGHESIGTTTPAKDYYLAEGTTAWGFITWLLIQNPNSTATDVTVTYMTADGPVGQPTFSLAANSRKTIRVNDALPLKDFSTKVHADKPIIAERSMFWGDPTPSTEVCHDSIGTPDTHISYYLPDGQTSEGCETWTLVQNPNDVEVTIEITYLTPTGEGNQAFTDKVPRQSRKTYNMADKITNSRAAIKVVSKTSGKKIIVERAMYWNSRGAGTETLGAYFD